MIKEKFVITCSVVVFKENLSGLHKTIDSFLQIPLSKKLFLIDNTPNRFFEYLFVDKEIEYLAIEENIGFGSGHNKIIKFIENVSKYHLILNPDVKFKQDVIPNLILELEKNSNISMIAPKVIFPNGEHQYSCRRYPTPFELIVRRFGVLKPYFANTVKKGEYRDIDLSKPFSPEYITGCFQVYKTSDFVKMEGFDNRYFLYMEDVDICRKIDKIGKKKLYDPNEQIIHVLKKGSSKKIRLLFFHISSAIKYFLKWGF